MSCVAAASQHHGYKYKTGRETLSLSHAGAGTGNRPSGFRSDPPTALRVWAVAWSSGLVRPDARYSRPLTHVTQHSRCHSLTGHLVTCMIACTNDSEAAGLGSKVGRPTLERRESCKLRLSEELGAPRISKAAGAASRGGSVNASSVTLTVSACPAASSSRMRVNTSATNFPEEHPQWIPC